MTTATLTKWGASAGIVIPKAMRKQLGLSVGDKVELQEQDGAILVKPAEKEWTLSSLMRGYTGPPPAPIDPGVSVGRELW